MRGSKRIWTPPSTTQCAGGRPIKEIEKISRLTQAAMTTHMPLAEELPIIKGKRSGKPLKVKQDSAPFARDIRCCTPSTTPTLTDTVMMQIKQRRKLVASLLTMNFH